MYQALTDEGLKAAPFQDSRPVDGTRDLAPVLGLLGAIAASAVLWTVPLLVWWMLG